jgi:RHS repeat-associated protein
MQKPALAPTTRYVALLPEAQRFLPDDPLVLLELPIDPRLFVDSATRALIIDPDTGVIRHRSKNNIGFRVGFYGNNDDPTKQPYQGDDWRRLAEDTIYGPLADVRLEVGGFGAGITDDEGRFSIRYPLPPCPGFSFVYSTNLYLELYYKRFNPRGSDRRSYHMMRPGSAACNGLGIYGLTPGTIAQLAATAGPTIYPQDFLIDLMVLSGAAYLANADDTGEIPLARDIAFDHSQDPLERVAQQVYDLDGDGLRDMSKLGRVERLDGEASFVRSEAGEEPTHQGIWLSSLHGAAPAEDVPPDLTRLADWSAGGAGRARDFKDRGLLGQISEDDLQDTDLYVFRESDGSLIAERKGLDADELIRNYSDVDVVNNRFRYTVHLLGDTFSRFFAGGDYMTEARIEFAEWQAAGGLDPRFHQREADHLRPGEQVRLVAINRACGYIGTLTTRLQAAGGGTAPSAISFPIDDLVLRPPNLKLWAEREHEVEAGFTVGETRTHRIGQEGAAEAGDTVITLYSEWYDHDGRPLPDALAEFGYTARLAQVIAAGRLREVGARAEGGENLAHFPVKPGRQIQVVRLPERVLGNQHLYLQVNGQPHTRNADFGSGGGQGILTHRPKRYVPVQVPVFDETATDLRRLVYNQLRAAHHAGQGVDLPNRPEPVYRWVYRPELQFSIYDLDLREVRRETLEGETQDVLALAQPAINKTDQGIDVLYGLHAPEHPPLAPYSYPQTRELVLALGEQEVRAQVGDDQRARFTNLEQLDALHPEDFLSLRLYSNNDSANVLYEWRFRADEAPIELTRTRLLGTFDPGIANDIDGELSDSYRLLSLRVTQPAGVRVLIRDGDGRVVGDLLQGSAEFAGQWFFVVTYDDIASRGLTPKEGRDFFLEAEIEPLDPAAETPMPVRWPGELRLSYEGEMLGQIVHHDVMIQRGNLSRTETDIAVAGRGRGLMFRRSYGNQGTDPNGLLGEGWRHNHALPIRILAYGDGRGRQNLPGWVDANRGRLFGPDELPTGPEPPLLVAASGTLFKALGERWYPQRGRHGTLETTDDGGFVHRSKDGTRYHFEAPSDDREVLAHLVEDRNGNRLELQLEPYTAPDGRSRVRVAQVAEGFADGTPGRRLELDYGPWNDEESGPERLLEVALRAGDGDGADAVVRFEYGAEGRELIEALQAGRRHSYAYAQQPDSDHRNLVRVTDSNGNGVEYVYGTPTGVSGFGIDEDILRDDSVLSLSYGPDDIDFDYSGAGGNVRSVTDARGNVTVYRLNAFGNPVRIDEPLGKTTWLTWTIDQGLPDNLITKRREAIGPDLDRSTCYSYDAKGNLRIEVGPVAGECEPGGAGPKVETTWDQTFSLPLSRTDRNGHTRFDAYDARGNLTDEIIDDGVGLQHAYNKLGDHVSSTGPRGEQSRFKYDAHGVPTVVSEPEGSTTTRVNDLRGRPTRVTDPNGNVTTYTYDALDNLVAREDPDGASWTASYDGEGRMLAETDRYGVTTEYSYDHRDRLVEERRDLDGASRRYAYDADGNQTLQTDWKGQETRHGYDALGRLTTTTEGDYSASFAHDLIGNRTREVDYAGRITEQTFDLRGRLVRRVFDIEGAALETRFAYDAEDNLLAETDAEGRTTSYDYNARNLEVRRTDALGGERRRSYDASDNLVLEVDEGGLAVAHVYDGQDRVVETTRNGSYAITQDYDANGNVVAITDARGHTTRFEFDELDRETDRYEPTQGGPAHTQTAYADAGRTITVTDPRGNRRITRLDRLGREVERVLADGGGVTSSYDANGNRLTLTRRTGSGAPVVIAMAYDRYDRPVRTTEAQNTTVQRVLESAYDPVGRVVSSTDGRGLETQSVYEDAKLRKRTIHPDGSVRVETRDRVGNLVETRLLDIDGDLLRHASIDYDVLDRPVRRRVHLGDERLTTVTSYDAVGNRLSVTDPRGQTTTHDYDAWYRRTSSERAGILLSRTEYDANDNPVRTTDANGNLVETVYTPRNLVEETRYGEHEATSSRYDAAGNRIERVDQAGRITSYAYDAENRLLTVTNPADETTRYGYDLRGLRVAKNKPKGNAYRMTYDALGRLTSVVDPLDATSNYRYDGNDNLIEQVDALGHRVTYAYDALDHRVAVTQPGPEGALVTRYLYDAAGGLVSRTDAKGQVVHYDYDGAGREVARRYPRSSNGGFLWTERIETGYDGNGNPVSVTETKRNAEGATVTDRTAMAYDGLDRLTRRTQRGLTVEYDYDANGNRTRISAPGGTSLLVYDHRNRLIQADGSHYTHTSDGRLEGIQRPNGTATHYQYDPAGRVVEVAHTNTTGAFVRIAYAYDQNGNRTGQVETRDGSSETTDYAFDDLDRLVGYDLERADHSGESLAYVLDAVGNRTQETRVERAADGTSSTRVRGYTYDAGNRLQSVTGADGDVVYSYDANGNTITRIDNGVEPPERLRFVYDSRDQLVQTIRGPPEAPTSLGRYDYDYRGLRIRQRDGDRGAVDSYYDDDAVLEERRPPQSGADGALLAHYRYDQLGARRLDTPAHSRHYHLDALGSTLALTDDDSRRTADYHLDPWGLITARSGDSINRLIFTGQEHDLSTGLVYFGARYYDPAIARFLSQDSVLGKPALPPSLHRYLYAYGNPLVFVDPDGHAPVIGAWLEETRRQRQIRVRELELLREREGSTTKNILIGSVVGVGNALGYGLVEGLLDTANTQLDTATSLLSFVPGLSDSEVVKNSTAATLERRDAILQTVDKVLGYATQDNLLDAIQEDGQELADYLVEYKDRLIQGDLTAVAGLSGAGAELLPLGQAGRASRVLDVLGVSRQPRPRSSGGTHKPKPNTKPTVTTERRNFKSQDGVGETPATQGKTAGTDAADHGVSEKYRVLLAKYRNYQKRGGQATITEWAKRTRHHEWGIGKTETRFGKRGRASGRAPGNIKFKRWRPGDAIDKPLPDGQAPPWKIVRARYWKNRYYEEMKIKDNNSIGEKFSESNLERMRRGSAPQDYNWRTGEWESRELHHVVPQRAGGSHSPLNLRELTPDWHAEVDAYRIIDGIWKIRDIP